MSFIFSPLHLVKPNICCFLFLCYMWFCALFLRYWPNAHKNNVKFWYVLHFLSFKFFWNSCFIFPYLTLTLYLILCLVVLLSWFLFEWRDAAKCLVSVTDRGRHLAPLLLSRSGTWHRCWCYLKMCIASRNIQWSICVCLRVRAHECLCMHTHVSWKKGKNWKWIVLLRCRYSCVVAEMLMLHSLNSKGYFLLVIKCYMSKCAGNISGRF
jgi:hypothetical protein